MKTQILVVDNFYNNPNETRKFILTQNFNVVGNYPGYRTSSFANKDLKIFFEKFLNKNIHWTEDHYNGSFQYTTKNMKSWIHRDLTDYAAVVYLSPNASIDSGTGFFKHKRTGCENTYDYECLDEKSKKEIDADSNDMSKWDMTDYISNKFNRLVIFNGTRFHRSMQYFGDDLKSGRLFQVFFFNTSIRNEVCNYSCIPRPISHTTTKKICILIFTTSRYEYLIATLESFRELVNFSGFTTYSILIDDYPLRRNVSLLNSICLQYNIDKIILNESNLGYSSSWKKAW